MVKTMTDCICWVYAADVGYFLAIYGNCVFCQEYFHGYVMVLVIKLLACERRCMMAYRRQQIVYSKIHITCCHLYVAAYLT